MGLFGGSSSASSTSTNHSDTWGKDEIEDFERSLDTDLDYENENLVPLNDFMNNFLNYKLNPARFDTAKGIINTGAGIGKNVFSELEAEKAALTGGGLLDAYTGAVGDLFDRASGFIDQQNQSIENRVSVGTGQKLANNAQLQNAGGAVAGSSAMNNSAMGIIEGGAESIEGQESRVAQQVLNASAHTVGGLARNAFGAYNSVIGKEAGIGNGLIKGGVKALNNDESDYWNAALTLQGYAQKQANVNRKNAEINNNWDTFEDMYWLQSFMQTQGIDTTSTTSNSTKVNKGGLL